MSEDDIRKRLRDRATELGLSYAEIAGRVGVSEAAIKKLMTTHGLKNFARLSSLCQALEISPNALLGFNEEGALSEPLLLAGMSISFEALGLPRSDADALAEIVLEAVHISTLGQQEIEPDAAVRLLVRAGASKFRRK